MLKDLPDHIRACHQSAAVCHEQANEAADERSKAEYLRMESSWMQLARSYAFVDSLEHFLLDAGGARGSLDPKHTSPLRPRTDQGHAAEAWIEEEIDWLRYRIMRQRVALRFAIAPEVQGILRELVGDGEERLAELEARKWRQHQRKSGHGA
jgi:hypothetical protein